MLFLFWLQVFILSAVISLLFSSSISGTYWPGEFIFQCPIFLLSILFMLFSRQEYWSGLPFPSLVDHIFSGLNDTNNIDLYSEASGRRRRSSQGALKASPAPHPRAPGRGEGPSLGFCSTSLPSSYSSNYLQHGANMGRAEATHSTGWRINRNGRHEATPMVMFVAMLAVLGCQQGPPGQKFIGPICLTHLHFSLLTGWLSPFVFLSKILIFWAGLPSILIMLKQ